MRPLCSGGQACTRTESLTQSIACTQSIPRVQHTQHSASQPFNMQTGKARQRDTSYIISPQLYMATGHRGDQTSTSILQGPKPHGFCQPTVGRPKVVVSVPGQLNFPCGQLTDQLTTQASKVDGGGRRALALSALAIPCHVRAGSGQVTLVGEPRMGGRGFRCRKSGSLGEPRRVRQDCSPWDGGEGLAWGGLKAAPSGSIGGLGSLGRMTCKSDRLGALCRRQPRPEERGECSGTEEPENVMRWDVTTTCPPPGLGGRAQHGSQSLCSSCAPCLREAQSSVSSLFPQLPLSTHPVGAGTTCSSHHYSLPPLSGVHAQQAGVRAQLAPGPGSPLKDAGVKVSPYPQGQMSTLPLSFFSPKEQRETWLTARLQEPRLMLPTPISLNLQPVHVQKTVLKQGWPAQLLCPTSSPSLQLHLPGHTDILDVGTYLDARTCQSTSQLLVGRGPCSRPVSQGWFQLQGKTEGRVSSHPTAVLRHAGPRSLRQQAHLVEMVCRAGPHPGTTSWAGGLHRHGLGARGWPGPSPGGWCCLTGDCQVTWWMTCSKVGTRR